MNSVRERRGPYARISLPQTFSWPRKPTPDPQSPSRRKFVKQKLRIANGIYGAELSSIPKTKKSSSWQSVPNAINFRDILRKTRPVSKRKRRRRPQSAPNMIDAPRKESGVSLDESNVNNRGDNVIYEGPDPPRVPISKFKEELRAVAGVSVMLVTNACLCFRMYFLSAICQ